MMSRSHQSAPCQLPICASTSMTMDERRQQRRGGHGEEERRAPE